MAVLMSYGPTLTIRIQVGVLVGSILKVPGGRYCRSKQVVKIEWSSTQDRQTLAP